MSRPGSVLLSGRHSWQGDSSAVLLHSAIRVLRTESADQVPEILQQVEASTAAGHVVAGFLAYEAGAVFELRTHPRAASTPVAWFGVYPGTHVSTLGPSDLGAPDHLTVPVVQDFRLNVTREEHRAAVLRVKDHIAAGDTYQANYTCHGRFTMPIDPWSYFLALVSAHPVPYAAYLNLGDTQILSLSPELFLRKRGATIESRPMKGTRPRGRTKEEDDALARALATSEKDRAENVMILDMMRNDLGRFCEVGSVTVPEMFAVERYRSVWQMTSRVTGAVRPGVSLVRIMADTFPAASITGAPKRRTMDIIRNLEREARGVYTGTIGLFMPSGDFTCNVAIRTLVHRDGRVNLGLGAGIVWDSDPDAEYEETLLKSHFAFSPRPRLRLFETLRLDEEGRYAYAADHAARLAQSAEYWGFPFDDTRFRQALRDVAAQRAGVAQRVHAELDASGDVHVQAVPLPSQPATPWRILIASHRTHSRDPLLFHKTTERAPYADALALAQGLGFDETLFINERGYLTEGAYTNLFVRLDGAWVTPPILDGLLPGIWRTHFMRETGASERSLTPADLSRAEAIVQGNSVRGAMPVREVCTVTDGRVQTLQDFGTKNSSNSATA